MITVDQLEFADAQFRSVTGACGPGAFSQRAQDVSPRDVTERHNDLKARKAFDPRRQVGPAISFLLGRWLVAGWRAPHGVGHHAVLENKTIVTIGAICALGKAGREEGFIKQNAGEIPRERTPRSVGSGAAGRKSDDQEAGGGVAERRRRAVEPVGV